METKHHRQHYSYSRTSHTHTDNVSDRITVREKPQLDLTVSRSVTPENMLFLAEREKRKCH